MPWENGEKALLMFGLMYSTEATAGKLNKKKLASRIYDYETVENLD